MKLFIEYKGFLFKIKYWQQFVIRWAQSCALASLGQQVVARFRNGNTSLFVILDSGNFEMQVEVQIFISTKLWLGGTKKKFLQSSSKDCLFRRPSQSNFLFSTFFFSLSFRACVCVNWIVCVCVCVCVRVCAVEWMSGWVCSSYFCLSFTVVSFSVPVTLFIYKLKAWHNEYLFSTL